MQSYSHAEDLRLARHLGIIALHSRLVSHIGSHGGMMWRAAVAVIEYAGCGDWFDTQV